MIKCLSVGPSDGLSLGLSVSLCVGLVSGQRGHFGEAASAKVASKYTRRLKWIRYIVRMDSFLSSVYIYSLTLSLILRNCSNPLRSRFPSPTSRGLEGRKAVSISQELTLTFLKHKVPWKNGMNFIEVRPSF